MKKSKQIKQKHIKKERKRDKRKRLLKLLLTLFFIALIGAAVTIYMDYQARPGFLERIWISGRGADYLTVSWERPRNVYRYVIECDGQTVEVNGRKKSATITGLEADKYYNISVRADSKEREGFEALTTSSKTKKLTHIEGPDSFQRFANNATDLKQTAETAITYTAPNNSITMDGDKIVFTKPGTITVTATTEENAEYASTTKEITVDVLDSVYTDTKNAGVHILYKLNKDNCECVRTLNEVGDDMIPQSFSYNAGNYTIIYVKKEKQKIISLTGERKEMEPEGDLGHANGLTAVNGKYYSVRGKSRTCTTFDAGLKKYDSFELTCYASGIGYDVVTGMFYTSSREAVVSYDANFNILKRIPIIKRNTTCYAQDCGAYGGIIMHCISGEDYQGINYIDFYDMINGKYLGSAECQLNEIESLIVDDEGYIELLCNTPETEDYIWKTPINMKKLCE